MSKWMDLIRAVVDRGISVTIEKRGEAVVADLNFRAKSHGYLVESESGLQLLMRYDEVVDIEDERDLLCAFVRAFRMRDFGNQDWIDWAEAEGLIKKTVAINTVVSYS